MNAADDTEPKGVTKKEGCTREWKTKRKGKGERREI
jgi:hypothetical protein